MCYTVLCCAVNAVVYGKRVFTSFYRCMKSGSTELSLYNLEWLLRAVCGVGAGFVVALAWCSFDCMVLPIPSIYFAIIMPRMSGKDYIYMCIKIIGVVMLLLVLPWSSLLVLLSSCHLTPVITIPRCICKLSASALSADSAHFHLFCFRCKRVHTFPLPHIVCQCHFKSQSIPLHSILSNV